MSLLDDPLGAAKNLVPGVPDLSSMLAAFASAFTQHTRLLKLHVASDAGIPEGMLLPHRLTGHEGINQKLRYELEVVSNDAFIDLKTLIGVPVQVSILSDEGEDRTLCGIVTEVHQTGSDAGFASYSLVIEDGLSVLRHSRTSRVAMGVNVLGLTDRILKAHLGGNSVLSAALTVDNRCQGTYEERPFWMQYDESDFDYLCRIWAREGISFVVVSSPDSTPDHPMHTLILFDDARDLDVNASERVRYHRADATESHDSITVWNARQTLQCGAIARSTWDHTSASVANATVENQADQGSMGLSLSSTLEDYRHEAALEGDSTEAFEAQARKRMETREGWVERFDGCGSVRHFSAGSWFGLMDHYVHDHEDNRNFVIVRLDVEAVNNFPKDLSKGLEGLLKMEKEGKIELPYRNRFECVRRGVPILMDEIDPPDPGILTATVVGPAGSVVHTDELGQIRVQFQFARSKEHPEAGASGTDADSAWVRQVETWSSQGFGGNFIPRVGDEVTVQFLGGDPDRPIITGSAANSVKIPASFAGVSNLPGDKALTGIRSQMLGGSGSNELIMDDTTGELRTQFSSDHAKSQLQLGFLVQPRSGGVGAPRGEGFELRTDAWGAVRGMKGLLVTTDTASGPHLDAQGLTGQVGASLTLSNALSEVAEQHGADKLDANESVKALKESAEATKKLGSANVAAFKAPVLGLSSPAGIVSATPASQVLSAGENLYASSGEDTNIGIGGRLAMAIKEAWSVFVQKSGIKIFAGKGNGDIQAHDGSIQIAADKDAKIISANGEIIVQGKIIRMAAGGAMIELTENDVNLTMSSNLNIKGNVVHEGAGSVSTSFPSLPKVAPPPETTHFSQRLDLSEYLGDGLLVEEAGAPLEYEIRDKDGVIHSRGVLDEQGKTQRVFTDDPKDLNLFLLGGKWNASMDADHPQKSAPPQKEGPNSTSDSKEG